MHVLVWLKNLQQTHIEHVCADILWGNPDSAYLVYSLQKSYKGSLFINEMTQLPLMTWVTSLSINSESSGLYRPDFVAMGCSLTSNLQMVLVAEG